MRSELDRPNGAVPYSASFGRSNETSPNLGTFRVCVRTISMNASKIDPVTSSVRTGAHLLFALLVSIPLWIYMLIIEPIMSGRPVLWLLIGELDYTGFGGQEQFRVILWIFTASIVAETITLGWLARRQRLRSGKN